MATDIVQGSYTPSNYASVETTDPHDVSRAIVASIRPDSLKSYLQRMSDFETRHTSSDTTSPSTGIGAARNWALQRFQNISAENDNRLVCSFLNWEKDICGRVEHKNIVGLLPGKQKDAGIVIIEAHFDSRCDTRCDSTCVAHGMEDNGSGSALVLELARVMAAYQFDRTILFMLTVAEEQGLDGARALADYCVDNEIPIAAVLNNDVIGGVICGETSSPPSCPTEGGIDSTQVRLFSSGSVFSPHKQLARYIKLQYEEELKEDAAVPMQITVMTAEDRTGRGGDHIPFRQNGFTAMRFTSANEHGDANTASSTYDDRQHTSDDVLGKDTDNDGNIDEWYVDFNYLARNASINANAAVMIAQAVCSPQTLTADQLTWKKLQIDLDSGECTHDSIVVAIRSSSNDWDTLLYTNRHSTVFDDVNIDGGNVFISAAYINDDGVESLFNTEVVLNTVGIGEEETEKPDIELLQNKPNPFDEATTIVFLVHRMPKERLATLTITDLNGAIVKQEQRQIQLGANEIVYNHGYQKTGTFTYALTVGEQLIDSKKMVFVAN
ncbi:MAG: hypothetical protein Salg2KO_00600 [Salibacteraceae bacterium]